MTPRAAGIVTAVCVGVLVFIVALSIFAQSGWHWTCTLTSTAPVVEDCGWSWYL